LDHLSLNQVVTIPRFATKVEPSKIYLRTGERYYVRDLVRALLINSANDAAEVLAVAVAGSPQNFAAMMNKKAQSLGCRHSHFVRANGLPARNQYSTAYDMTLIMAEADRYPFIVQTLKTKTITIQSLGGRRIGLRNHNRMLWKDHREVLGKTGWTRAAKHCFVGLINASGRQVFVAMLGSRKLWKDLRKLVDYQFGTSISKVKVNDKLWSTAATKRIQICLQRAGFNPGHADGQFGPQTIKAVEGFQAANGLQSDGIVGQNTWTRLKRFA
jgi:D-alanyl-D-alanine carboxypeptidase (penicillin-binding protein 5/6)